MNTPAISLPKSVIFSQPLSSSLALPKREIAIVISIFVIANSLFFGGPLAVHAIYDHKILPLVKVESVSVGGKTLSEAKQALIDSQSRVQDKVIMTLDGMNETVTLSELGLYDDFDQTVKLAYEVGRSQKYRSLTINRRYGFNEDRLKQTMTRLFGLQASETKNASLKMVKDAVEVEPAVSKQDINWPALQNQIMTATTQASSVITVEMTEAKPQVTESDLQAAKAQVEQYLATPLTIQIDDRLITTPRETIGQWVVISQDQAPVTVTLDSTKIQAYVSQLSKKYAIKPKTEIAYDDGTLEQAGEVGRNLDEKPIIEAIISTLNNGKDKVITATFTEVPFAQKTKTRGYTAGLYDSKYIEINLTEQKMYTFEGENLVGTYAVSTGKWSMPTPEGEFEINNKVDVAYSATYKLYMPRWMAFIGSKYGIHGLPYWASGYVEGEDHLGKPVSHGCVRLSHADADTVYNWANVGTKVYIHK